MQGWRLISQELPDPARPTWDLWTCIPAATFPSISILFLQIPLFSLWHYSLSSQGYLILSIMHDEWYIQQFDQFNDSYSSECEIFGLKQGTNETRLGVVKRIAIQDVLKWIIDQVNKASLGSIINRLHDSRGQTNQFRIHTREKLNQGAYSYCISSPSQVK